jgi:hypothetical protein
VKGVREAVSLKFLVLGSGAWCAQELKLAIGVKGKDGAKGGPREGVEGCAWEEWKKG